MAQDQDHMDTGQQRYFNWSATIQSHMQQIIDKWTMIDVRITIWDNNEQRLLNSFFKIIFAVFYEVNQIESEVKTEQSSPFVA